MIPELPPFWKQMAEQMTGCRASVEDGGLLYDLDGHLIDDTSGYETLRNEGIVAPAAGAGSIEGILTRIDFTEVKAIEQSNSAGDWTFIACDGELWFVITQSNRGHGQGFSYTCSEIGYKTEEEAVKEVCGE